MERTLVYYFEDGTRVTFNKYSIYSFGYIKNKKTGRILAIKKNGDYNVINIFDEKGKRRGIYIGHAIVSTFIGRPPTLKHTADHIDKNPENDTIDNLRWLDESGQSKNQDRSATYKSAFVIVKDDVEKTSKEWVEHLRDKKNSNGREYTDKMINHYARRKQYGFSYKEYPDIPGEVWKKIVNSENAWGHWEISNMNRVKQVTKYAENVLSDDRLGLKNGYPFIIIGHCHILSFKTFFPEEYTAKKSYEMILHKEDNKMDFRPHKLRIGTSSENGFDAHANGCYNRVKI